MTSYLPTTTKKHTENMNYFTEPPTNVSGATKSSKKKNPKKNNWDGFASSFMRRAITLGISVCIAMYLLYVCKIAQSTVLPDNFEIYPITDKLAKNQQNVGIPFAITKIWDSTMLKLGIPSFPLMIIPYNPTSEKLYDGRFLKTTREYHESGNTLAMYISNVLVSLYVYNNMIVNGVFGLLHKYVPESLLLVLFAYYWTYILAFFIGETCVMSIFSQFAHLPDMFREYNENNKTWSDPNYGFSFSKYLMAIGWVFMTFPASVLFTIFSVIVLLATTGTISHSTIYNTPGIREIVRNNNLITFMMAIFRNKSQMAVYATAILLFLSAKSNFSQNTFTGFNIALGLVFFGTNIFSQYIPPNEEYNRIPMANIVDKIIRTIPVQTKSNVQGNVTAANTQRQGVYNNNINSDDDSDADSRQPPIQKPNNTVNQQYVSQNLQGRADSGTAVQSNDQPFNQQQGTATENDQLKNVNNIPHLEQINPPPQNIISPIDEYLNANVSPQQAQVGVNNVPNEQQPGDAVGVLNEIQQPSHVDDFTKYNYNTDKTRIVDMYDTSKNTTNRDENLVTQFDTMMGLTNRDEKIVTEFDTMMGLNTRGPILNEKSKQLYDTYEKNQLIQENEQNEQRIKIQQEQETK